MTRFIATPELAPAMGAAGRRRVEEEFDVNRVNRTILEVMGLA
jgi:hypothetical protein